MISLPSASARSGEIGRPHLSVFCFGDVEVDPMRFEVRRSGRAVPLEPRAFDVLLYLVQHPNRVVTKHDLARDVWNQSHLSDAVVNRCVSLIRKAILDDARNPTFVLTVWRRGYRVGCPVRTTHADGRGLVPATAATYSAHA
jgi:DNA-binding winged helix-turn-helix (wHTH) protein